MRTGLFTISWLIAIGCSGDKNSEMKVPGAPSPITEADVKAAVMEMVDKNQGYYRTKAKSVELLSGLLEPSDPFFQKNPEYSRDSVACYVLIECEPKSGQTEGAKFNPLVVVTRDSGKVNKQDAGKLKVPANMMDMAIVKDFFGEEWVKQNPRPAIPKKS